MTWQGPRMWCAPRRLGKRLGVPDVVVIVSDYAGWAQAKSAALALGLSGKTP